MRKKSLLLIGIGAVFMFVALLGALFPFVPIVFLDAKYLSDNLILGHGAVDSMPEGDYIDPAELLSASGTESTSTSAASSSTIPFSTTTSVSATPQPETLDNRLFISRANISVPIVEGKDAGALWYGAWRYPSSSKPAKGGNTVIFGHRFRYLPPNNTTFYNLDKMAVGDNFVARWYGKNYKYTVKEIKVVAPEDLSVLNPTDEPTMTLITCTPLFTTNERLVVVGTLSR